ncbi:unnamed protein product, partial [Ectocarpus sp. 12 AP-2014]
MMTSPVAGSLRASTRRPLVSTMTRLLLSWWRTVNEQQQSGTATATKGTTRQSAVTMAATAAPVPAWVQTTNSFGARTKTLPASTRTPPVLAT